jgi:hypothetical protein
MAIRSQSDIVNNINTNLADNNAGLISAADVRENMKDIAESIQTIVGSGNFDSLTPFTGSNVRAKINNNQYGRFIAESGVEFPNGGGLQLVRYPGPNAIQHNDLAGLTTGNPHTQYMHTNGLNKAIGNMPMGDQWINASGNLSFSTNNRGIKFTYVNADKELLNVGNKTTIDFDVDNSTMFTAKSTAQAWIRFNGSGNMSVTSSYNIKQLKKTSQGKFEVYFNDNTFADGNYVAIGNSNSRTDSDAGEDFDLNTVGIVTRDRNYLTFYVLNKSSQYVDAAINDLVVFGNASGVIPSSGVTLTVL